MEQAHEEMHRMESRRVLRVRSSPSGVWVCHTSCVDAFINTAAMNPILLKYLWRLQHTDMMDL